MRGWVKRPQLPPAIGPRIGKEGSHPLKIMITLLTDKGTLKLISLLVDQAANDGSSPIIGRITLNGLASQLHEIVEDVSEGAFYKFGAESTLDAVIDFQNPPDWEKFYQGAIQFIVEGKTQEGVTISKVVSDNLWSLFRKLDPTLTTTPFGVFAFCTYGQPGDRALFWREKAGQGWEVRIHESK